MHSAMGRSQQWGLCLPVKLLLVFQLPGSLSLLLQQQLLPLPLLQPLLPLQLQLPLLLFSSFRLYSELLLPPLLLCHLLLLPLQLLLS